MVLSFSQLLPMSSRLSVFLSLSYMNIMMLLSHFPDLSESVFVSNSLEGLMAPDIFGYILCACVFINTSVL